jgi:hypothetical protein
MMGMKIDKGDLTTFVDRSELDAAENVLPGSKTGRKLAQQRYDAAAIGLIVGPTRVEARNDIIAAAVSLPDKQTLPPRPKSIAVADPATGKKGNRYIDHEGKPISRKKGGMRC